jgi:2-amino-4-hydroxy-6-hydroxymethyldihydropteridine diphosphokinase
MKTGIALGSNLGDRLGNLRAARGALEDLHAGNEPMRSSRVWETEPIDCGPEAAPYLNAVVEIEFTGDPVTLLHSLQAIERKLGRPERRPRNAPRTVDLDVLYTGELFLKTDEITLPHPRMHLRRFVLNPLRDIRPDLVQEKLLANAPEAHVKVFAESF